MARKIQTAQTNYTSGEIDPLVKGRIDNKVYYNGAEKIRNALVIPQGGARRRPGLQYIDVIRPIVTAIASGSITATAANGGTANNAKDRDSTTLLTTTNNLSTTNPYVVVQYDLGSAMSVIYADVENFSISAGSDTTGFYVEYSSDATNWTRFAPSTFAAPASTTAVSRRFSSHTTPTVSARYWRFVRKNAADLGTAKVTISDFTLWTTAGALSNVLLPDFTFSLDQAYLFAVTDYNIAVYKDDVWQCDVRSLISSDQLANMNWTQSLDTFIIVHQDVAPVKIVRQGAHNQWNPSFITFLRKPTHDFSNVSIAADVTPSGKSGSVTLTASAAAFSAGNVGKYFRGGDGFAQITAFTDSTHITVTVIEPYRFTDTDPIGAGDWNIEEDAWSDTWGWPRSVTFHEGRLWFGGSKTLLQTFWGSKSRQFFDFGSGSGLDDEAIEVTLDTDQVSAISQIYSGRNLSIFTSGAEFYVPSNLIDPITPSNVRVTRATSRGIKQGLRVIEVSGAILFIQRGGKAVREFLFSDVEGSYSSNNLSLVSSHLIVDPVDIAIRKSTSTDEADFAPIVNSDGTMCILTTLRDQNVTAFSLQQTQGKFIRAGVVDTAMYFAVERVINGATVRYLEKFNNDLLLDSAIIAARPNKDTYTATAGQTVFNFTTSISSTDQIRVLRYDLSEDMWEQIYDTDYTHTALPGTGSITISPCGAGDQVVISYPTDTFSGLTHLKNTQVRAVGDGAVKSVVTSNGSGVATFTDEDWETTAQCGLEFPDVTGRGLNEGVWIKDLPVEPQLPEGVTAGLKRRIIRVVAKLYETTHLLINGIAPDFDYLDADPSILDQTIVPYTGDKTVAALRGWDEYGQVDVTQTVPAKLTLLSLVKRVAI